MGGGRLRRPPLIKLSNVCETNQTKKMYIYIYIYIYIYKHIHTHTHTYILSLSHTHTYINRTIKSIGRNTISEQLKVLAEIHILPKLIHSNNNNYKNGNNRR